MLVFRDDHASVRMARRIHGGFRRLPGGLACRDQQGFSRTGAAVLQRAAFMASFLPFPASGVMIIDWRILFAGPLFLLPGKAQTIRNYEI